MIGFTFASTYQGSPSVARKIYYFVVYFFSTARVHLEKEVSMVTLPRERIASQ